MIESSQAYLWSDGIYRTEPEPISAIDPADICPHGGGHRLVLDATAYGSSGTHYEILRCSACGYVSTGWKK